MAARELISAAAPGVAQWAATFSTTAATKNKSASARITPPARAPGRPVTMPAIATTIRITATRAATTASARTAHMKAPSRT